MNFAKIDSDLSYWQKQTQPLFSDLLWNVPERKTGRLALVGGHQQSFATPVRLAEYITQRFPLDVTTFLPDALRSQLPPLPNLTFCASTATGSFAKSSTLQTAFTDYDATLLVGDLSKNSATTIALSEAITGQESGSQKVAITGQGTSAQKVAKPLTITRDAVDALLTEMPLLLQRPQTFLVASMLQLQKIFRAIYYPKMILLTQPLLPALTTLHKFTLTYPATIVTFHQDQIIVATQGKVSTTHIVDTNYTPLTLWSGQLAANLTALNLYNPGQPYAATTAAILLKN